MNSKKQISFPFWRILTNIAISVGVAILLTSCSANTYNFLSINDPFIDTTQSIKVRAITGISSKELQITSRVYGNLVVGASVFANYWDKLDKPERLSVEGLIAYNIPLLKGTDWKLSIGGGYSESEIEQKDKTILTTYVYETSRAKYTTRFWQIGLNCPIDKNTCFKFLFKKGNTYYNHYYYKMDHGSPRSTVETYDDIWEFKDKTVKFLELVSMLHYNLHPNLSLFGELGISGVSLGFNPDDYKTNVSTNEGYPTTESANVRQPTYSRLLIRAGIELKIKRFRLYKKEPSKFLKTTLF